MHWRKHINSYSEDTSFMIIVDMVTKERPGSYNNVLKDYCKQKTALNW